MQTRVGSVAVPPGLRRLMNTVEVLPWRYAPFFSRIGELWGLSEDEVARTLARAANRSAWRRPAIPGIQVVDIVGGAQTLGATLHLVRLSPNAKFPAHRHLGYETLLVLEGSYTDSLGRLVEAGEAQVMPPGTEHSFLVSPSGPCVAASIHSGLEFTGPFLRWWSKLMGQ